jgi:hypothetical protein
VQAFHFPDIDNLSVPQEQTVNTLPSSWASPRKITVHQRDLHLGSRQISAVVDHVIGVARLGRAGPLRRQALLRCFRR